MVVIANNRKSSDHELVCEQVEKGLDGKHSMGIELGALWADRDRKIEPSSRGNHGSQIVEAFSPPAWIEWIAISSKSKVLKRVEARE